MITSVALKKQTNTCIFQNTNLLKQIVRQTLTVIANIAISQRTAWRQTGGELTCWPALRTNFQIANRQKISKCQLIGEMFKSIMQSSEPPPLTDTATVGPPSEESIYGSVCVCSRVYW